jgi:hypothetical protein
LIFTSNEDTNYSPHVCWAYLGCQGAQGGKAGQTVNLGTAECFNPGTITHEIMHSLGRTQLGFFTFLIKIFQTGATHEQNREDRNTFVKIVEKL